MSQLINSLATIEISQEIVKQLDLESIYSNFSKNFRKLDDLKDFRTEYEKKNKLMRWWHNDKLRDAQLDSAEVQAEFSKTIGQLMMISIMQSKKLAEQQGQLNEQQGKLKEQADGIAEQAQQLQIQHRTLAEQSERLEKLVTEYFALKGLTEEGAQKLIAISREIKGTKESMLQEFAQRTADMEVSQTTMLNKVEASCANLSRELQAHVETNQAALSLLDYETRQTLVKVADDVRAEWRSEQEVLRKDLDTANKLARDLQSQQQAASTVMIEQTRKLAAADQRIAAQETISNNNEQHIRQIQAQMEQSQIELKAQLRKMKMILSGACLLATLALVAAAYLHV